MREFLMELYIQHGEREFGRVAGEGLIQYGRAKDAGYITYKYSRWPTPFQLTPKGLEYIKNLDNP